MAVRDTAGHAAGRVTRRTKALLFFAFAFAVMADPVSSVAYAIEAALPALHGHLGLLLPTMGIRDRHHRPGHAELLAAGAGVPGGRWLAGGSGPAFGEEWSFLPIGALVVDFALTIAISLAAAGSAIIAYLPGLAPAHIPIALGLTAAVAALTWFGHGGRMIFAVTTWSFIIAAVAVLGLGWISPHAPDGLAPITGSASPALVAVILAFPVAMALGTGTEAPATSIAQLGQLENDARARFGRGTLALTIGIVGGLTIGLTALAVHLHVGIPRSDSTQIADLAHTAAGKGGLFAFFQIASSVLLLAAASSSFQAGPGLLKALARTGPNGEHGLLPPRFARTNRHHTRRRGCALRNHLRRHHPRRERPRTRAGAGLCRIGVRQLPRRPACDGPLLAPRGQEAPDRDEHRRGDRGRLHVDRQPRARLPAYRDRRHRAGGRFPVLAMGAGGSTARDPSDRARSRGRGPSMSRPPRLHLRDVRSYDPQRRVGKSGRQLTRRA